MRYRSTIQGGYQISAIAGTDVVSFGIDFTGANTTGLLGFAVERHDLTENERYFMYGFKVFKEIFPDPQENVLVSTNEHPVQSFVWDDLTAKPGHEYIYYFYPTKGKPKFLVRESAVKIKIRTEVLYDGTKEHDVFFNRGVASSQAYARKFFNLPPDKILDAALQTKAFEWLSRDLDDALYKFIDRAKTGDKLFGCFYEFHYEPAVQRFKKALDRGVDVKLIIDCKVNESTDKDGNFHESFPREVNLRVIKKVGIPKSAIIQRTACKSAISHNKFLLYQPSGQANPTEIWTGSTNLSEGGIFGQTNVGHWIRNKAAASLYKSYWDLLSTDPGAKDDSLHPRTENKQLREGVTQKTSDIPGAGIPNIQKGVTPIFSPRATLTMLDTYAEMVDTAKSEAMITLAFGINKTIKNKLVNNTSQNSIVFMILEKKDAPAANAKNKAAFVRLNAKNNVYEAYGCYIKDKLYRWAKETSTLKLGLNTHVMYIHTKFLLMDPLGDDPIIVTGSANFSDASTTDNDENMVIIRGDLRAADIYFTEFNRLFNHYYYRSVLEELNQQGKKPSEDSLFLVSDASWLAKYQAGKLRTKRLSMFTKMKGTVCLPV